MSETMAEEIARLQREIVERQMRLQYLVCGDQREAVSCQKEKTLRSHGCEKH
jgi:hypothetical protein